MNSKSQIREIFSIELLRPKYWISWLLVGLLFFIVKLPYPFFYQLGKWLGLIYNYFDSRRRSITQENIALCFPEMPIKEQKKLVKLILKSAGIAVFEVGMAWFWSDWRLKRKYRIHGYDNIKIAQRDKKNILLLGPHFLTIELSARMIGVLNPGVGVYMKNQNPVLEYVQLKGRLKSNKYMINMHNTISMVKTLKRKELLWYSPDHDLGHRNSVFVPLFAVDKVATTVGTARLIKMTDAVLIPVMSIRKNGKYHLHILPQIKNFPADDDIKAATLVNQITESMILKAPDQYMWLHRRFKTRPHGEANIYSSRVQ